MMHGSHLRVYVDIVRIAAICTNEANLKNMSKFVVFTHQNNNHNNKKHNQLISIFHEK